MRCEDVVGLGLQPGPNPVWWVQSPGLGPGQCTISSYGLSQYTTHIQHTRPCHPARTVPTCLEIQSGGAVAPRAAIINADATAPRPNFWNPGD